MAYRECEGYEKKLLDEHCQCFDEKDFSDHLIGLARKGLLRLHMSSMQTDDCLIWWAGRPSYLILWWKGRLFDVFGGQRLGYFHFIQSKYQNRFQVENGPDDGSFIVTTAGLRPALGGLYTIRLLGTIWLVFFHTLPWYFKQVAKRCIPGNFRKALKRISAA
jgi:hypothetical protein